MLAGLLSVILLGLLVFSFMPMKLPVAAEGAFTTTNKPDSTDLPEVRISILKTGKMLSRQVFVWRGGNWNTIQESGMAALLVRHPQGDFLFDTGFGRNVDRHFETLPFLFKKFSSIVKEKPAVEQLQQQGIAPEQIKMIFISHSHWDHISGLEDFPNAEVWMPQTELDFIHDGKKPGLIDQMIDNLKVHAFEFTNGRYENFERSFDLFSDGSIVLVPLPGHTEGSAGMFVNLHSGKRFFFVGDLTWALEGLQLPAERPWVTRRTADYDAVEVRQNIIKVYQLMEQYPDLIVVPAHDRNVQNKIAGFPEFER